jgi:DNA-binding transcriptional MerR regulator
MSLVNPRDSALPSKLFFRIGEVAGLVGVEPHVLRYWEREFRSIRPTKSAKGQRVYSRKDVENLLRVRDLLYRDGFTIAGAKKRLQRGAPETTGAAELANDLAPERDTERELGQAHAPASGLEPDTDHRSDDVAEEHLAREQPESGPQEQPESGPRAQLAPAVLRSSSAVERGVHGKLSALRAEVEAFLDELEAGA